MGQYYNNQIEDEVRKITNNIANADVEVSVMLGQLLRDYAHKGKVYEEDEIKEMIKNKYNINIIKSDKVFERQFKKNKDSEEKAILENTDKEKIDFKPSKENLKKTMDEFKVKYNEMINNTYIKYKNLLNMYEEQFTKKFNDRL